MDSLAGLHKASHGHQRGAYRTGIICANFLTPRRANWGTGRQRRGGISLFIRETDSCLAEIKFVGLSRNPSFSSYPSQQAVANLVQNVRLGAPSCSFNQRSCNKAMLVPSPDPGCPNPTQPAESISVFGIPIDPHLSPRFGKKVWPSEGFPKSRGAWVRNNRCGGWI